MTQKEVNSHSIIELLNDIGQLMELSGENPFKVRAFKKASETLGAYPDIQERARAGTLTDLPGIGKGIADVITEFVQTGKSHVRNEIQRSLPVGLIELTQVEGLGPKKARILIDELGIHSISELEYACRENRLKELKSFGEKVQGKILKSVAFIRSTSGQRRLGDVLPFAQEISNAFKKNGVMASETGALRRREEILTDLEYLLEVSKANQTKAQAILKKIAGSELPVRIHTAPVEKFGFELARTTSTEMHWKALGPPNSFMAETEEEFYSKIDIPYISPEMRETGEEVTLSKSGHLHVLPWDGIRGIFHTHTTRSDGANTLEEMVISAKGAGYEYIGISDHSQSAFYAHGIKPKDLSDQEREVREVQERHPEIKIFWGIESDILADGSLDYDKLELKQFDFVIASIHSRFGMDRKSMTDRILNAVRNPFTRFIGHITGRLLLGRSGYDIDMEKIITEASKQDVAIELNANPARLDIDWRWGKELRKNKTWVSINPDAHETSGIRDTDFGVIMARKALLPEKQIINSRSAHEVEKWLKRI